MNVCSADESESKNVIFNACSSDKIESKIFHISVNTGKLRYATNETNDEEDSVTDHSVINAPIYFKIFRCGKKFLKNIDATYDLFQPKTDLFSTRALI